MQCHMGEVYSQNRQRNRRQAGMYCINSTSITPISSVLSSEKLINLLLLNETYQLTI